MALSPLTDTPVPVATDPPAGHTQMTAAVAHLETFTFPRFPTLASLAAAIPAPVAGQVVAVGADLMIWDAVVPAQWRQVRVPIAKFVDAGSRTCTLSYVTHATLNLGPGGWIILAKGELGNAQPTAAVQMNVRLYDPTRAAELDVQGAYFPLAVGDRRHFSLVGYMFNPTPITAPVDQAVQLQISATAVGAHNVDRARMVAWPQLA